MLTPEQYSTATSRLRRGERPESPEDAHHLMDMIDEYEAAQAPGRAQATEHAPSFGAESLGAGGPVGGDLLEQQLGDPEANEAAQRQKEGLPLNLQQATATVRGAAPAGSLKVPKMSPQQAGELRAQLYNDKLATASKLKSLARPPEYIPPQSASAVPSPMAEAVGALPSFAGGNVDHYVEPSEQQFREAMRPVLGDRVDRMDRSSEAYKEFADAEWMKVFDQAEKTGTPVVRHAFKDHPSWLEQVGGLLKGQPGVAGKMVDHAADDAVGVVSELSAGAHGADEAAFAGLGGRATGTHDEAQKLQDNSPISSLIGSVLGVMAPNSIGGVGAGFVGGALPKATTGLGRVATAAAKGAGAATADVGARDAASELSGESHTSMGDEATRLGISALLGGGIGAGADLVGAAAGLHGKDLRENTRLGEAENAGVKTSAISGIKPGERIEELTQQGRARGNDALGHAASEGADKISAEAAAREQARTDAFSKAASEGADRMVSEGRATTQERIAKLENDVRSYYGTESGRTKHSAKELLDAAMDAHAANTYSDTSDIAGRSNSDFRALINGQGKHGGGLIEPPQLLNDGEAGSALTAAQARNPDAMVMSLDDARRKGIDVDALIAENEAAARAPGRTLTTGPKWFADYASGATGKDKVLIVPRRLNAQQVDQIADNIDAMAINEKGQSRAEHPAYKHLQRGIRDVRDKFGPGGPVSDDHAYALEDNRVVTGYSALKQEHADLIQETKDALQASGMGNEPTVRPDIKTRAGAFNALLGVANGGPRLEQSDKALRELADKAGVNIDEIRRLGTAPEGPKLDTHEAAFNALLSHSKGGPRLERNDAILREIAKATGVNIDEIRGIGAFNDLQNEAPLKSLLRFRNGAPSEMGHMSLGAVRLRLDPLLSTLAMPAGAAGAPYSGTLTSSPLQLRGGLPGALGALAQKRRRNAPVDMARAKSLGDMLELTGQLR